jgi:hypothetical protein
MNKIFVRLKGGLGNQLFMYAFGLAHSKMHDKKLIIDNISGFGSIGDKYKSVFTLDGFNINESFIDKTMYKYIMANRYFWYIAKRIGLSYIEKNIYKYDDTNKKNEFIFDGYWQSYVYFDKYKKDIKKNLQFSDVDNVQIQHVKKNILNNNSVAIGLRFYEDTKDIDTKHIVIDESYYADAIKIIEERLDDIVYFVFSTDIKKAQTIIEKYTTNKIIFIDPILSREGAKYDLYLMSLCKHFIISNGTFYWWASYLGESENSIVIAAENTFPNQDALPDHWLKIKRKNS